MLRIIKSGFSSLGHEKLIEEIKNNVKQLDSSLNCVIKADMDYT